VLNDVVSVALDDGTLRAVKPRYAGKVLATMRSTGPAFVSLRPNAVPPREAPREPVSEALAVDVPSARVRLREVVAAEEEQVELTEAETIVSGGRGMGGPENWHEILDLAGALRAAHGASRAVVDAGWRPHAEQVGSTSPAASAGPSSTSPA
jgi:electron transfer flavoprotein alpha subunit